jgi:hypothetical protein
MASHYGSPLFPFYNPIFRSPLAPIDRDFAFVRHLPATWTHPSSTRFSSSGLRTRRRGSVP